MTRHATDLLWDSPQPAEPPPARTVRPQRPNAPTPRAPRTRTVERLIVLGHGFRVEVMDGRVTVELRP
jgi:hypothetical protein